MNNLYPVSYTHLDVYKRQMGASGSGKTTLLNCISTIDTVSAGSILLEGCAGDCRPHSAKTNAAAATIASPATASRKDLPCTSLARRNRQY